MVEGDTALDRYRVLVLRSLPELARSRFRFLAEGWHSIALDVDDRLIIKFPKSDVARAALLREASLLAVVRPDVRIPVPAMRIHGQGPVFSVHEKLPGEPLLAEDYRGLTEPRRARLGEVLGGFYADLHRLDAERLRAAGGGAIEAWQTPDAVRGKALPLLGPVLRRHAEDTIAAFERLPPDPFGTTYGFFDGHGWNMAFDHDRGALNGVFDFADSGFGPVHQDFIYSNFITPDLTRRIVATYEARSGRRLDRRRIGVLTAFHRLSELAGLAHDARHVPEMIRHVAEWAEVAPF